MIMERMGYLSSIFIYLLLSFFLCGFLFQLLFTVCTCLRFVFNDERNLNYVTLNLIRSIFGSNGAENDTVVRVVSPLSSWDGDGVGARGRGWHSSSSSESDWLEDREDMIRSVLKGSIFKLC